jgi:hypothetical protein
VQAPSPTDRLACAILPGEQAIQKAVASLVEAGFATECISVIWLAKGDEGDEGDEGDVEQERQHAELDEATVSLRTGIRRLLPIGGALGAVGGAVFVWFTGDPTAPFVPQLITGAATGSFLGAMSGIVLGLGYWDHVVELPPLHSAEQPVLVAVDVVAQGREPEACRALSDAGAKAVKVCTREEAEQLVREAGR